ncbi:hypothetical protein QBC46DRAFT_426057, partial [Diplogelasinospora grovesii]
CSLTCHFHIIPRDTHRHNQLSTSSSTPLPSAMSSSWDLMRELRQVRCERFHICNGCFHYCNFCVKFMSRPIPRWREDDSSRSESRAQCAVASHALSGAEKKSESSESNDSGIGTPNDTESEVCSDPSSCLYHWIGAAHSSREPVRQLHWYIRTNTVLFAQYQPEDGVPGRPFGCGRGGYDDQPDDVLAVLRAHFPQQKDVHELEWEEKYTPPADTFKNNDERHAWNKRKLDQLGELRQYLDQLRSKLEEPEDKDSRVEKGALAMVQLYMHVHIIQLKLEYVKEERIKRFPERRQAIEAFFHRESCSRGWRRTPDGNCQLNVVCAWREVVSVTANIKVWKKIPDHPDLAEGRAKEEVERQRILEQSWWGSKGLLEHGTRCRGVYRQINGY